MKIPFAYIFRSLWARRLTTALTVGGITLVTFVFAAVLMLAYGLEKTLVGTGSDDNVIVIRRAAQTELQSQIDRDAAHNVEIQPEVALGAGGKPLATSELFVIINLRKIATGDMGNVTVRGISTESMTLRPQIAVTEGRPFAFGTSEVIVGSNIAKRFAGCAVGQQLKFGGGLWTIVGIFDGHGTGFDSEIWGDVVVMMPAFGRPVFSSVTVRLKDPAGFESLKKTLDGDPRFNYLEIDREKEYYAKQSEFMAAFIRWLGIGITIVFGFGAVIGAVITMYAAVANRTAEIGTMRAIGFRRGSILAAFLFEGILISLAGAALGLFLASFLQLFVISTLNFGTFVELAFGFIISPSVVVSTFVFAVVMGIVGGFFPAMRAARLNIVNALRAS